MSVMAEWLRRVWYLLNRGRLEDALQREMQTHRELMAEPARFGNTLQLRERSGDVWGWAWLDAQGGMLMLTAAKEPLAGGPRAVLYLYNDDVAEARARLAAKGIAVGPLEPRFYAKKGEFRVDDPDGHVLMFTHL